MRSVLVIALAAAVAIATVRADPADSIPGIVDLTPDNFDKIVNGAKHALVEFYAPWCGHCKSMVPELKKLGEILESDSLLSSRFVVGKVNADKHRELGTKFGVQGFPTIKYFKRGKAVTQENAIDYNQARTSVKFHEFLRSKIDEDKGFARVPAFDEIAKKFASGDTAALLKEAQALVSGVTADAKENADLYISFMTKAIAKGSDYLKNEKARLDKMLSSGGVATSKVEEFSRKLSVLGAFLPSDDDAADAAS